MPEPPKAPLSQVKQRDEVAVNVLSLQGEEVATVGFLDPSYQLPHASNFQRQDIGLVVLLS